MSLETVVSILDKILIDNTTSNNKLQMSLLGGEPTDHSQFEAILYLCLTRNIPVLLISNFLFSSTIRDMLVKAIKSKRKINFLANATELRVSNRLEIFKENYNIIYAIKNELDVTCGFTLDGELSTSEGFDNYLTFLSTHLISIEKIRLSLNFANQFKNDFYFINNQSLGELMYYAVRRSLYAGAVPLIDCITFPCMYKTKKMRDFIKKYDNINSGYICKEPPSDYLPDGTVRYCFPTFSIFVDSAKYQTDTGIRSALRNRYSQVRSTLQLPETCQSCQFFKDKSCVGPCLGFMHI
jgi:hypothetical protein